MNNKSANFPLYYLSCMPQGKETETHDLVIQLGMVRQDLYNGNIVCIMQVIVSSYNLNKIIWRALHKVRVTFILINTQLIFLVFRYRCDV